MIKPFRSAHSRRQGHRRTQRRPWQNIGGQKTFDISRLPHENLKVVPLGGLEEVGRNMTFFEYGDDILIIDMGLQFPEEGMPGIDYIIPNISYLKEKKKNIRGVVITHGHMDHVGAIPYLS